MASIPGQIAHHPLPACLPACPQMLVAQLRKCCNHPYLFPGAEPEFDGQTTGEVEQACCLECKAQGRRQSPARVPPAGLPASTAAAAAVAHVAALSTAQLPQTRASWLPAARWRCAGLAGWAQQDGEMCPSPATPAAPSDSPPPAPSLQVLDRLLGKLKRRGHRVVLFSQVGGWAGGGRSECRCRQVGAARLASCGPSFPCRTCCTAAQPSVPHCPPCCAHRLLHPPSPPPFICSSTCSWTSWRITCACGATSEQRRGGAHRPVGGGTAGQALHVACWLSPGWLHSHARCPTNEYMILLPHALLHPARRYARLDGSTNRVQRMIDIKVGAGWVGGWVGVG